jgi:predicted nuclease with TOPRIM domain
MSKTVSRHKYESMKEKAQKWLDKALDYEAKLDDVIDEKDRLESENSQLQDEVEFLTERCKNMSMQIKQYEKEKKKKLLVEELSKHFVVKE